MKREIRPVKHLGGTMSVPGDKSITHRAVLLSLLAKEPVRIRNAAACGDVDRSLAAVQRMGVTVEREAGELVLKPPPEIRIEPDSIIDCGNSGTTARLLAGIAAGSNVSVVLAGDESLMRRPMKRIVDPLTAMGAELYDTEGHLPLTVHGKRLLPFEYRMPVPSAQVKSAVLLAGLASNCTTTVREEVLTRNHTELMIQAIGEGLTVRDVKPVSTPDPNDPRKKRMVMPESFKREVLLGADSRIVGGMVDVPGDLSTAAYFLAAAAIGGHIVTVVNLGLNPTRTAFLDYLKAVGAQVEISDRVVVSGEARGTVKVTGQGLKARKVSGETAVGMIDELPMVAVMAAFAEGTTIIRDAGELRVKESDRLAAVSDNLSRIGVKVGMLEDGLAIEGKKELTGADFEAFGDHRIAMAFSIASLFLVGPSTIDDDSVVAASCPTFFDLLESVI